MRLNPHPDRSLVVAIIAGVRFGVTEPHAGGLERHSDVLARELTRLGHRVTVFAGSGDPDQPHDGSYVVESIVPETIRLSDVARADVSMPPEYFMIEHDAYLHLANRLRNRRFDVVHNNSLHYLPVMAVSSDAQPTVHTLHTPPTPWLESAHRVRVTRTEQRDVAVVSLSHANARQWSGIVDHVVHNGVDLERWSPGDGDGGYAFWSGRLVPEKGTHLAIAAARRVGLRLLIAGPMHDQGYFDECLMGEFDETCVYVGHCDTADVVRYLRGASVAVVTPCWDEPFGLVVAEAMACGTPVAAFSRGAIDELIDERTGRAVPEGDVDALARAMRCAATLDRRRVRELAEQRFAATTMAERYVDVYRSLAGVGS